MDLSKSYEYFQPEKIDGRVHIIGCGSVGSTIAENLARCGVTKMTLWDFDHVESKNIANQMFRHKDIGKLKTEALRDILADINPDIVNDLKLESEGWQGKPLSGYVFLCVDSIELRRKFTEQHMDTPYIKAIFDFRTLLESAQHYAADWSDIGMRKNLLNSMQFSDEEASDETPVSACGITLGVVTTVRMICALGVSNFINHVNGKTIKKFAMMDVFNMALDAF